MSITNYTEEQLQKHLHEEHKQSPFSEYIKEIVYGGNDGIVTTFAVVAGFTGANTGDIATFSFITVLLFGLANLFADASSMGLGNFLSIRSEQGLYKKSRRIERRQIKNDPELEKAQTVYLLKKQGFEEEDAKSMTELYAKNPEYWTDFMMKYELGMAENEENPFYTGIATFLSFIVFGFIPLSPYLVISDVTYAFIASCGGTLLALTLLGIMRWFATKENIVRAVLEVVLIGGISAVVAFVVGLFFRG
ncbi:VIT1/CCC1 transporter family protein [Candidatus Dojkabacteria bacterium]|uniref:VIT1/CCC1 transporter family protein n=1 Tax=Candidatus Dojkabacteria bacterium TaxID=2099670 RepID=A0A955L7V0_9BACT|nr:VIT1/CCC1 transporter family protein [Candidatus Dojkabacteria bacterium]